MAFCPLLLAVSSLFSSLYVVHWHRELQPAQSLDGKTVQVTAMLQDTPTYQYQRYYYQLRVQHVMEDETVLDLPEFTLRVSDRHLLQCEVEDTITAKVHCTAFEQGGLYSTANSRFADGIAMGGYFVQEEQIAVARGTGVSLRKLAIAAREEIFEQFREVLSTREAGLVQAMVLGRKDALSETDEWNFRKVGAAHLLVISGLHMTAVVAALCAPLNFLVRGAKLRALLSSLAVLCFLAVTGFPPAAQRSAIMCIIAFFGAAAGKRTDSLNSLAIAVLFICLKNPCSGGDIGFTLSVLSTLGVLLFATPLQRFLSKPLAEHPSLLQAVDPVLASVSVTLSAMLMTLPLQASVFGGVSLLSPVANLLLVLPCTALLYLALPTGVLALVPMAQPILQRLLALLSFLARVILTLATDLASLHGFYLDLSRTAGVITLVVLLYLLVLAGVLWHGGRLRALSLVCCTVFLLFSIRLPSVGSRLTVALAEDSSCVVLLQNHHAAVIALGGYRTTSARELLVRNRVEEVELLCYAANNAEVRAAACAIVEEYEVEKLMTADGVKLPKELREIPREAAPQDGEESSVLQGVTVRFEQEMQVITVRYGQFVLVVETEDGTAEAGSCHVLITPNAKSDMSSPFTILQNDAIIEDVSLEQSRYVLPQGNGCYLTVTADGNLTFGGESAWLGTNLI